MDERLLRGTIQVNSHPDPGDALANWQKLREAGLDPEHEPDVKLMAYLGLFYDSLGAPPTYELVKEYFEKDDQLDVVDRLGEVAKAQPYIRTNYASILKAEAERLERKAFTRLLREAVNITENGMALQRPIVGPDGEKKKVLRGVTDAWDYVQAKIGLIEASKEPPLLSIEDVFERLPPIDWLCEGLRIACNGGTVLLAGYGFSGKSLFAQALALAVASGSTIGGHACRQGKVVHLDYEQGRYLTNLRYQRLALGMGHHPHQGGAATFAGALAVQNFPSFKVDSPGARDKLLRLMEGRRLLIIDSLRAACPSLDENSSEIRRPLDMLNSIADKTGCVPVVIHHSKKPQQGTPSDPKTVIRGSSAIFDAVAAAYVLSSKEGEPTRMTHQKERFGKLNRPVRLIFEGDRDDGPLTVKMAPDDEYQESADDQELQALKERILQTLRLHPGVPSQKALTLLVKGRHERNVEVLNILIVEKRVERRSDGYYSIELSPDDLIN